MSKYTVEIYFADIHDNQYGEAYTFNDIEIDCEPRDYDEWFNQSPADKEDCILDSVMELFSVSFEGGKIDGNGITIFDLYLGFQKNMKWIVDPIKVSEFVIPARDFNFPPCGTSVQEAVYDIIFDDVHFDCSEGRE